MSAVKRVVDLAINLVGDGSLPLRHMLAVERVVDLAIKLVGDKVRLER
jgi:hypothetical protein